MQPKTHNVLDLAEHPEPILSEPIQKSVEPVRTLARLLLGLKKPVDAVVTSTLSGLDIDLRGAGKVPEKVRLALAETAQRLDLARLSLHGDLVVEARPPIVRFGRADVVLPPGGFLQATEAGEEALAGLVTRGRRLGEACGRPIRGCGHVRAALGREGFGSRCRAGSHCARRPRSCLARRRRG